MYKVTFIYTQSITKSNTKYYKSYSSLKGLLHKLKPSLNDTEIESLAIGVIDCKLSVIQASLFNIELTLVIEKLPDMSYQILIARRVVTFVGSMVILLLIVVLAVIAMIIV
jgi:hypothetical protein